VWNGDGDVKIGFLFTFSSKVIHVEKSGEEEDHIMPKDLPSCQIESVLDIRENSKLQART
jgi:hypothetical protein